MKKTIILLLLAIIIIPEVKSQGKGFNSPHNYFGYRPQYRDTLYIDYSKGKKIEFIYRWFDLFRENEETFEKYFFNPFEENLSLLKEKTKELHLKKDSKYHITLHVNTSKSKTFKLNISDSLYNKKGIITYKNLMAQTYKSMPQEMSITLTERDKPSKVKEYQLEKGELVSQKSWQNILEIEYHSWKVRFYLNELEDIETINIEELKSQIRDLKEPFIRAQYYKYFTKLHYQIVDDKLVQTHGYLTKNRPRSINICDDIYFGTSIVKGEFSVDANVGIGISVNDKQKYAAKLGLQLHTKSFGENNKVKTNAFIDAVMASNFANNYEPMKWYGVGIGYLVRREGEIYGKDTWRVFFKAPITHRIGIQPEINYSFHEDETMLSLGLYFSL